MSLLFFVLTAFAHDSGPERVEVRLEPGSYRVDVELHAPAWAARDPRAWEQALATLPEQLRLSVDGAPLAPPSLEVVRSANGWSSWTVARHQGPLPLGADALSIGAAHATGPWMVVVTSPDGDPSSRLLSGGEHLDVPLVGFAPEPLATTARRYVGLGFLHILPRGLDHVLFVLGLFLLADRMRPLLLQVSAFTVAHTLTLGASLLGWVSLPASLVEPLIAASIVLVALENVVVGRLTPWRPALVFLLGLLHGLGFAGVLLELGLPPGQRIAALLAFNVGVELGQLAVIGLAFALLGWAWKRPWYRDRIVVPGSLGIAAVGLYWTVTRLV